MPALVVVTAAAPVAAQRNDSLQASIAAGKSLFEGRGLCFSCHGKHGEGVIAPTTKLVGRPLTHTKATLSDIAALIKNGVDSAHSTSGQVMPPKGGSRLSDAEVDLVAAYVLDMQRRGKTPPE